MVTTHSIAEQRPGSRDMRKLIVLLRFLLPYKVRFACAMLALLVAAGTVLMIGQGLKHVIDEGFSAGNASTLDRTLFTLIAMIVVLGIATFSRYYLISWVAERFTADIRRAVFVHILKLTPGFFELARTGEVISRLTNDTQAIEVVVGGAFSYALRNLVLLAGGMVMLLVTSPKLTLLVVLGIPFVLIPILVLGRRVRNMARAMQDRLADASSFIDEALHEIRTVQAYVHEAQDRKRFGDRVEQVFHAGIGRARYGAMLVAAVIVLAFGAIGVILWVGGQDVIAGRLSPGNLSAFVFYAVLVANGLNAVTEVYAELQRAAGASERLMELLSTQPVIQAPANPLALPVSFPGAALGSVTLENVSFNYPSRPDTSALENFSLRVNPGEVVALVGPSGAGKTTVFQLLLRFYDPYAGRVMLDGVDVKSTDPGEVRARIALVSQDPVIFAADVWENVRYGRADASEAQVREACRHAYALDFIEAMPEGFNTYLGERGVRLSGGQRQRIAIARAFLADRSVLLLDEATSALDAESEKMVQLAIQELMKGRTTIIVAHRLATVKSADRIVVMDQGRIVAEGTHQELVRERGLYARLAALQFSLSDDW